MPLNVEWKIECHKIEDRRTSLDETIDMMQEWIELSIPT